MRKARLCLFASLFILLSSHFNADRALAQMPELSPLPQTGKLKTPSDPDKFKFVVAGDNRPAKEKDPQPKTPGLIFAAAKKLNPAFVFWTGDTISGKQTCDDKTPCDKAVAKKQYDGFLSLAAEAQAPVFNAPGNHEMDNAQNVPDSQMQGFYTKYMAGLYGAFNYGNSRFIALNTDEVAAQGVTQPANGYVSSAIINQLEQDLKMNQDKKHIFIFMHRPVKAEKKADALSEPSASNLKALFKKYRSVVAYVIAGHEHLYYNAQSKNTAPPPNLRKATKTPLYLVSGGAGAPFKRSCPPGSFHHYLVFAVNGKKVNVKLVPVNDMKCVPSKGTSVL
jgi:hypothetical protein